MLSAIEALRGTKRAFPSGEGGLTRRSAEVKTDEESEIKLKPFLLIHRKRSPFPAGEG